MSKACAASGQKKKNTKLMQNWVILNITKKHLKLHTCLGRLHEARVGEVANRGTTG